MRAGSSWQIHGSGLPGTVGAKALDGCEVDPRKASSKFFFSTSSLEVTREFGGITTYPSPQVIAFTLQPISIHTTQPFPKPQPTQKHPKTNKPQHPQPKPPTPPAACKASRLAPRSALRSARRASRASCWAASPSKGSTCGWLAVSVTGVRFFFCLVFWFQGFFFLGFSCFLGSKVFGNLLVFGLFSRFQFKGLAKEVVLRVASLGKPTKEKEVYGFFKRLVFILAQQSFGFPSTKHPRAKSL